MATSGTTDFSGNQETIIKRALRLIGVLAQGEEPTTDQHDDAASALNGLVKAWQADGMPLWAMKTYEVTMVTGVGEYIIGVGQTVNTPKPLRIVQGINRNNNTPTIDIPMRILTQQEYLMLGNKTTQGMPIQLYYQPLLDTGRLSLFPTPDATTAAQNKLVIIYQAPFEDFDADVDTPDFPQEWYDAIIFGLACRLAPEYGLPSDQRQALRAEAKEIKDAAMSMGTEEGSLYFQRDYRSW